MEQEQLEPIKSEVGDMHLPKDKTNFKFVEASNVDSYRESRAEANEAEFFHRITPEEIEQGRSAEYFRIIGNNLRQRVDDPRTEFLFNTIQFSTDIPEIAEIWERIQYTPSGHGESIKDKIIKNLASEMVADKFPTQAWLEILDRYKSQLYEMREWLKSNENEIKQRFIDRFLTHINLKLKFPKTEAELQDKLKATKFLVADPLGVDKNDEASNSSGFNLITYKNLNRLNQVMLSEDKKSLEEFDATMMHELLHVVSDTDGIMYIKTKHRTNSIGGLHTETSTTYSSQWSGVAAKFHSTQKFVWLNEALTERQAAELTERNPVVYPREILLLELISIKGNISIDFEYFRNAYFEKKSSRGGERSLESWKDLISQIREAYPHDISFLVRMDAYISKHGIDKAIELMQRWDNKNPIAF